MIQRFVHAIFPSRCIGCGKIDDALCATCIKHARKSLTQPNPYTVSVFDFKDPLIRKVIHAIKYYHRRDLIPVMATSLAEEILHSFALDPATVIVPIPMHASRYTLRTYNHAEILAEEVAKLLKHSPVQTILTRTKKTVQQAKVHTKHDRLTNQHNTYKIISDVSGIDILLIDDVTTTGATLEEARTLLLKHGAVRVRAATLAH